MMISALSEHADNLSIHRLKKERYPMIRYIRMLLEAEPAQPVTNPNNKRKAVNPNILFFSSRTNAHNVPTVAVK